MAPFPIALPKGSAPEKSLGTLTHPAPELWVLEIHSGKDNRITVELIEKVLGASCDIVEKEWRAQGGAGAFIITGKQDQDKFFSNGSSQLHTA